LFERFSTRFGAAIPNPDVGPERALHFEIGAVVALASNIQIEGALFYSDLEEALIQIPVALGGVFGTVNQTRNVAEGEYYGGEVAIAAGLADTLTLAGNYTYIERDLTDPTNPAFHPLGVPTHKLLLYVDWRFAPSFTLTPSIEAASDRWTVTSSSLISPPRFYETGAYALVNFVLAWNISERADVLLGGRNLFDEDYQLVDGFPEEGRNFYVSLRYRR
jgi:iron complex outermembrane receptor protein